KPSALDDRRSSLSLTALLVEKFTSNGSKSVGSRVGLCGSFAGLVLARVRSSRQQLTGRSPNLASGLKRYLGVHSDRQLLMLAVEAIREPPKLRACGR